MRLITKKRGLLIAAPAVLRGRSLGSFRALDTAIQFRMGMGVAGDVNRAHPASIQPALNSPANPVGLYGQPVVIDGANAGVRPLVAGDQALTAIWGVVVRPYPIQQSTTNQNYGAVGYGSAQPPANQPVDVLRGGYVMVSVVGAPVKGGPVYIWTAASGGGHTQGGFEAANPAGNGMNVAGAFWNSPADANGIAELILNNY